MELKPGYKMTEVGVIPEDWNFLLLENIIDKIVGGGTPRRDSPEFWGGAIPWATVKDFTTFSSKKTQEYISEEGVFSSATHIIPAGTLIIATRIALGKTSIYEIDIAINQDLKAIFFKININVKFMHYWCQWQEKNFQSLGNGSTVQGISLDLLKKIHIALPSNREQQSIAAALSDVDELLSSLDRLIAKKKDVRLAAMQELLTGKTRLPGFSGPWSKKLFGELFEFLPTNAYTRAQFAEEGTIRNIHYGDILTKYENYIDVNKSALPFINDSLSIRSYEKKSFLTDGDIIIANTAEDSSVGKAVEVINVNGKILSGQHTFLCRPKIKFIKKFLGYIINAYDFQNQMNAYITGIKVSSISKFSISKLKLKFPPLMQEQQAIASVLSDMDAEIEALEARRDKVQNLKTGMMQELLTGRTRLVSTGATA